ncbi:chitosanase [Streptomyces sp. NPDC090045]|uniref:chitosanase n=1 Tax=Streptomyces sp. NPDC090045 TaxID=3365927 RepID=UPI00382B62BC
MSIVRREQLSPPPLPSASSSPSGPCSHRAPAARCPPAAGGGLTAEQRRRADQLVSVFENNTTEIQYGYAKNIRDGTGVTAGRAGFTTSGGDALKVIEAYTVRSPDNPLSRFIP